MGSDPRKHQLERRAGKGRKLAKGGLSNRLPSCAIRENSAVELGDCRRFLRVAPTERQDSLGICASKPPSPSVQCCFQGQELSRPLACPALGPGVLVQAEEPPGRGLQVQ